MIFKNITKKILALLFFAVLYSASASAQDGFEDGIPCGMEATATGMQVKAYSGEICPEDIAYQSSYLLFSEVFSNPTFRPFVLWFVSEETLDSEFTLFANEVISVSTGVYFLFSAVALLAWSLFVPILAFKGYQYYLLVQKTGSWDPSSEDEQSNMDTVKLVGYFLFLVILMLPAGVTGGSDNTRAPLTVGQVASIIGILPAHYGGNILYSTYLHSVNLTSTEVDLKEDRLLPMGEELANRFVEGQMCQMNTRSALFGLNAKPGTDYFGGLNWFSDVRNRVSDRYDQCLAYVGVVDDGPAGDVGSLNIEKAFRGNRFGCNQHIRGADDSGNIIYYQEDLYGYNHTCMQVMYSSGLEKFESILDRRGDDGIRIQDTLDNLSESYATSRRFFEFRVALEQMVLEVLRSDEDNRSARHEQINDLFINYADNVLYPQLVNDSQLNSGTNEEKQIKYLAANSFMLGSGIENKSLFGNATWGASGIYRGSIEYPGIPDARAPTAALGVDTLIEVSRQVAALSRQYHCAVNWRDHTSTRLFITQYNSADSTKEVEALFENADVRTQCIEFLHEDDRGTTDFDRYIRYPVVNGQTYSDLEQMSDGTWTVKRDNEEEKNSTQDYMLETMASEYFTQMQLRRYLIAGYTVAVKKAVADALGTGLSQREAETESDEELRGKGWGIMGGALLYLSQNRQSSSHVSKSLEESLSVNSGGSDTRFVDRRAFGSNIDENKEMLIEELFAEVDLGPLFMVGDLGASAYLGPSGILDDEEEAALMQQLFYYMERLFLSPVDHIKAASGMPLDRSLADGLNGCFEDGGESCLSGGKHPIVAMADFGHDMMDNMLTLMVTTKLVGVVHGLVMSSTEKDAKDEISGEKKKKKGFFASVKQLTKTLVKGLGAIVSGWAIVLLSILGAILMLAKIILDALYPMFVVLFVAGAIFAYIIPMMSYVYGFMMMLLSIVGVVVIGIVLPFYVISKMWYIDKEYQNGFRKFYEEMLGPYLTPLFFVVSAIVSWTIIVVIMYGINTTFALLYQGLGSSTSSGWGISSFTLYLMMYVMYFVAVFVLFRFGLGIMKSMPDLLKEKVGLKKSNDDAYIESLGFEQYVNAQVMRTIGEMPAKAAGRLAGKVQGSKMNGEQLEDAVRIAEEQAELIRQHGGPQAFAEKMAAFEQSEAGQAAAQRAQAEEWDNSEPDLEPNKDDESSKNSQRNTGRNRSDTGNAVPLADQQGSKSQYNHEGGERVDREEPAQDEPKDNPTNKSSSQSAHKNDAGATGVDREVSSGGKAGVESSKGKPDSTDSKSEHDATRGGSASDDKGFESSKSKSAPLEDDDPSDTEPGDFGSYYDPGNSGNN